MKNVTVHIDFLLEYSIYYQALKGSRNAGKEHLYPKKIKPEIIRYVCYFKSMDELEKFCSV